MKKLMTFMLTLLMCIGMMMVFKPMEVKAADIASGVNGTCHWVIDENGVLTIEAGVLDSQPLPPPNVEYSVGSYWKYYSSKITKVVIKPGVKAGAATRELFSGFSNCTEMDVANLDTSATTNMVSMFAGCSKVTSLDVSNWDTSKVTDMRAVFADCNALKNIDVSNWDVSVCTNLTVMFDSTSIESMDLSKWNTQSLESANAMFQDCRQLKFLDVSNWKLDSISYSGLTAFVNDATSLKQIIAKNWSWSNGANIWNGWLFYSGFGSKGMDPSASVEFIDVTGWDLSNVKNFHLDEFFLNCPAKEIKGLETWDTSNISSFKAMFSGCSNITSLDLSNWDFSSSSGYDMFSGFLGNMKNLKELECKNWKNLPAGSWNSYGFGRGMGIGTSTGVVLDYLDVTGWDLSKATSLDTLFGNLSVKEIRGLNSWDTSSITNMDSLFQLCDGPITLDVSNWDTSNVTDMGYTFCNAIGLKSLDLSKWDTSNVTDMSATFVACYDLEYLDISGFDTSKVTTMSGMLYNIKDPALKTIVLGPKFTFKDGAAVGLNVPPTDDPYNGMWVRMDRKYGPYTSEELMTGYTADMAGVWIWDHTGYIVSFEGDGAAGSMPSLFGVEDWDVEIPANVFSKFGYEFDHWDDGNGHTYADKAVIPANTYGVDDKITFTAVWRKRDTSVSMENGEFEFQIKAGEKATFNDIPAGTSYQVYELTPDGWVLVQQENASGVIEALEESAAVFWNQYQPGVTTVQFSGLKTLDGHPASEGSYKFDLLENGKVIDTTTTQDGGFIQFKVIEYDAAGDHTYTIREVESDDDSVDYDTHEETVNVKVTDDGAGNLSSEVTYDEDGIKFENHTRPGILRITKNADVTEANKDDTFTFEIEFTNENGMPIGDEIYWYVEN